MQDLTTCDDIIILVDQFYNHVRKDSILRDKFAHVDWSNHLPTMYKFWASMLLGEQSYQGNPFQKHMTLSLQSIHFNRWLELFHQTIDENFSGEKAIEAKARAQSIARVWQHKLGLEVK